MPTSDQDSREQLKNVSRFIAATKISSFMGFSQVVGRYCTMGVSQNYNSRKPTKGTLETSGKPYKMYLNIDTQNGPFNCKNVSTTQNNKNTQTLGGFLFTICWRFKFLISSFFNPRIWTSASATACNCDRTRPSGRLIIPKPCGTTVTSGKLQEGAGPVVVFVEFCYAQRRKWLLQPRHGFVCKQPCIFHMFGN